MELHKSLSEKSDDRDCEQYKFHRTAPAASPHGGAPGLPGFSGSHKSRYSQMFPTRPVPIVLSRRDEAIDVSHARIRAPTRNLPFHVTHVTHGCHVFTLSEKTASRDECLRKNNVGNGESARLGQCISVLSLCGGQCFGVAVAWHSFLHYVSVILWIGWVVDSLGGLLRERYAR
ncbi:hypothetical protein DdX_10700 [Ditylenchus destructor]|uniref:Uncharacterized protein n=1 Tax=Ditylenchus destructor TaxID=166010 RepID=A0AAD4QYW1_9BILA|nr:hypothetical protein DdX_10700 [Ditylenchus destructor]